MLPLGGPISEYLAALGAIIGGGVAIGSIVGGIVALAAGAERERGLELAAVFAIVSGAIAVLILVFEEVTGLP